MVKNVEGVVRKTPNLRKLRCIFAYLDCWGKNKNWLPVLDTLSWFETLKFFFNCIMQIFFANFKSSTIARLVNHKVLNCSKI